MHSEMSQSTFFVCFAIVYYSFLLGWLLMRNATLSCITFPWMNIRALWSFQAVGVKFLCQSVTQSCPEYCWAANPHTLPLSANHALPILAKQTLTLQLACSNYHPPALEWVRTEPILLQPSLQPLFPLLSATPPSVISTMPQLLICHHPLWAWEGHAPLSTNRVLLDAILPSL